MPETDDFVGIVGALVNFVQNERVAAYNDGVDMTLANIKDWMTGHGYKATMNTVPDLLDELRSQMEADRLDGIELPTAADVRGILKE
jgi:hypothetical protein